MAYYNFYAIESTSVDFEGHLKGIKNHTYQLIKSRALPITRRESFCFGLSNLSVAQNNFRFSVGLEDDALLEKYAILFSDMYKILIFGLMINENKFTSGINFDNVFSSVEHTGYGNHFSNFGINMDLLDDNEEKKVMVSCFFHRYIKKRE